jgi:hypothetical protein
MGMITGSGRVNLLSDQIWRYRVKFGSTTQRAPTNPLRRGAAGWAAQATRVR